MLKLQVRGAALFLNETMYTRLQDMWRRHLLTLEIVRRHADSPRLAQTAWSAL